MRQKDAYYIEFSIEQAVTTDFKSYIPRLPFNDTGQIWNCAELARL